MSSDATSLPMLPSLPAPAAPANGRIRPGTGGPADPGGTDRSRRFHDAPGGGQVNRASRP